MSEVRAAVVIGGGRRATDGQVKLSMVRQIASTGAENLCKPMFENNQAQKRAFCQPQRSGRICGQMG